MFSIWASTFVRLTVSQAENWTANFHYFLSGGVLGIISPPKIGGDAPCFHSGDRLHVNYGNSREAKFMVCFHRLSTLGLWSESTEVWRIVPMKMLCECFNYPSIMVRCGLTGSCHEWGWDSPLYSLVKWFIWGKNEGPWNPETVQDF